MLIKPLKYRLAMVHKLLFHPFVHPDFPDSLSKRNYSLQSLPPVPPGPRVYLDGQVAMKNRCSIETNNERKLLAVEGANEKFIEIMKELILISQEDFNLNLESDLDFMEFTGYFIVSTDKNPINTLQKFRTDIFDKFAEIFNHETTLFGIRLVPNNLLPSSRNWFDIQIQPRLTESDKEYYISATFRSNEYGKVIKFSEEINSKVASIIALIEE
ncbi:MAG: hypothetical protein SCH70_05340 [Candidatus Methanoperedens sp.]|nr:hypothetical protein [Candidatus Methanoperedens sp.]